jgi:zinc transporter 1/2/3
LEVLLFKAAAILLILISGLLGGLLPLRISVAVRGRILLSLGNAFAAGIFLGAGLLHMLADANEKFESFAGDVDYPFVALICGLGFLLVLFLEKVLVRDDALNSLPVEQPLYPFVLFFVLSIHSIIAGVSLGLEQTLISSAVIFIAIISHKGSAAFALGVSMRSSGIPSRQITKTISFFSCMTPLGIGAGAVFADMARSSVAVKAEAVFDALAAGTFLYVATLDIIEEVFQDNENRLLKLILMSLAFALMALIAIWT